MTTDYNNNSPQDRNKNQRTTGGWLSWVLPVLLILLFSAGCAQRVDQEIIKPSLTWGEESSTGGQARNENGQNIPVEKPLFEQKPKKVQPIFKNLTPLDTERLSISVVGHDYEEVLQILARTAALNLIISPRTRGVLGDSNLLTIEFQEMTLREILDSVTRMLNIAWYEENGSLFIEPFISSNIDLDFLGSIRQSTFEVGGAVFGESGGSFVVQGGTSATVTDIYTNIETSIASILGTGAAGGSVNNNNFFVLNRQTGHLLIRSRPKTVAEIEKFINLLREKYRRQVLIEAKIIEVNLSQKHALGIDWRHVNTLISRTALRNASNISGAIVPVITGSESFYAMTLSLEHANINAIFHALEEYGQLSVLSNPRLKAMNGQSAIMSVGQSVAYLATVERDVDGETGDITYTTEIDSVFDGVLLGITPVIEKNDIITLHIVPIKSDLVELKTVTIGDNATQITLPMVNLREMSTVARVNSGDIVLLGGLIMESTDDNESGLPFLSDIPVLGRLFNYETQTKRRVELVVALQVKVIENY